MEQGADKLPMHSSEEVVEVPIAAFLPYFKACKLQQGINRICLKHVVTWVTFLCIFMGSADSDTPNLYWLLIITLVVSFFVKIPSSKRSGQYARGANSLTIPANEFHRWGKHNRNFWLPICAIILLNIISVVFFWYHPPFWQYPLAINLLQFAFLIRVRFYDFASLKELMSKGTKIDNQIIQFKY